MRRFIQTRRGISTVVTAAILLTAVTVLGTALVAFSNSKLTTFETGLASSSSDKTNKINENLFIENVWFLKNWPTLTQYKGVNATLTNVANEGLTVTDIKLIHSGTTDDFPQNIVLFPGKSISTKLTIPSTSPQWQSKIPFTISVTTARGLIYTTQAAPP